jgi:hypothetical protein
VDPATVAKAMGATRNIKSGTKSYFTGQTPKDPTVYFPTNSMMLVGDVTTSITRFLAPNPPVKHSSDLIELAKLGGQSHLFVAFLLDTPELARELPMVLPNLGLDKLSGGIGLINATSSTIDLKVIARCKNPADATNTEKSLQEEFNKIKPELAKNKEINEQGLESFVTEVIDSVRIASTGNDIEISLQVSITGITQLVEKFQNMEPKIDPNFPPDGKNPFPNPPIIPPDGKNPPMFPKGFPNPPTFPKGFPNPSEMK